MGGSRFGSRRPSAALSHINLFGGQAADLAASELRQEMSSSTMDSFAANEAAAYEARDAHKPHATLFLPEAAMTRTEIPDVPSAMPSRGSALHSTGECQPCAWFWRPDGCHNGKECGRCHLCPEGEIKARKKKKITMMRLGLVTPKNASPMIDQFEPRKVDLGTISSLREEVGFAMGASLSEHAGKVQRSSASPLKKVAFLPVKLCASADYATGEQSSSPEHDCSTAYGPEEEGTTSGASAAGSASDDEAPAAASRSGAMVPLPPGLQAPLGTPSHGSALHRAGTCLPCARFWRTGGCQSGKDCSYCHLCPDGSLKKLERSKRAMSRLGLATPKVARQDHDSEAFNM